MKITQLIAESLAFNVLNFKLKLIKYIEKEADKKLGN
jgi:hypothetical protein